MGAKQHGIKKTNIFKAARMTILAQDVKIWFSL
jgi:hypothetical protein